MKLVYDLDDMYISGTTVINVHEKNFVYEVKATGDYEKLKKKYYKAALKAAAYKYISEYADFITEDKLNDSEI